jgi:hypothetical protein
MTGNIFAIYAALITAVLGGLVLYVLGLRRSGTSDLRTGETRLSQNCPALCIKFKIATFIGLTFLFLPTCQWMP